MPTMYRDGAAGSHGFGTPDRTCLRSIRTELQDLTGKENKIEHVRSGLQDLTGWELQIVHAYEVSGRTAWSHGFGTPDSACLQVIGSGCRISRVRNNRSNMPTRYQDEAAGSHGFGTPDRTCLQGIRTGLQHLTGSGIQIEHARGVSGWGCRNSRVGNSRSDMTTVYQDGASGYHG